MQSNVSEPDTLFLTCIFCLFTKFVKIGQRSQRSKEKGFETFPSFRTLPIMGLWPRAWVEQINAKTFGKITIDCQNNISCIYFGLKHSFCANLNKLGPLEFGLLWIYTTIQQHHTHTIRLHFRAQLTSKWIFILKT